MPLVEDATGSRPYASVAPNGIGWHTLGPVIALTSIAFAVVALRLYTRVALIRAVGYEDFLISLSMILSIAYLIIVAREFLIVERNRDTTPTNDHPHASAEEIKLILSGQCIYLALTNITKASVVTQYLKIFRNPTFRILQFICYAILVLLLASCLLGILWGVFLCSPVQKLWLPRTPGTCLNSLVYWTTAASINTGLDFIVWLMPMPVISGLKLPRHQMIGLFLLFLVGGFACFVGIVRIYRVRVTAHHKQYAKSGAASVTWSSVEANTGVICSSLVCLKPLIIKLFPNLLSSQTPVSRHVHLQMITTGQSEGTVDTWTCSTYVGTERNESKSPDQGHPSALGINVTFETTQTTEVDHRRGTSVGRDERRGSTSWEMA